MPTPAPPCGHKIESFLRHLGQKIHAHRKGVKVSAVATAEAAGISRMTLNRIERGEASVTMGAYLNVISVLGLELELVDPRLSKENSALPKMTDDTKIRLSDYPQLKKLAWQVSKAKVVNPKEALNLYERNWRHVNLNEMTPKEQDLIHSLLAFFGKERLLV